MDGGSRGARAAGRGLRGAIRGRVATPRTERVPGEVGDPMMCEERELRRVTQVKRPTAE
jgi:hypothetical protein